MSVFESTFYVTGGTLRQDAACYVERQADKDLLDGLLIGEFCYVLTSRQMGKSSLMVRTAGKLREQGVQVVVLDLTAIGQNLTPEQWYDGLLVRLGRQLDLEDELEEFWAAHRQLGPCQRLFSALRDVVLGSAPVPGAVAGVPPDTSGPVESATTDPPGETPGGATGTVALPKRLVLFVDELDVVRSLPFSTDEFFAAIRECYNRRTEDAEFNRLTFCLLGVATPSDLIRDTRTTPFNIGRRIVLNDFTPEEAAPLAGGLDVQLSTFNSQHLLDRILYWTHGHPYLTQRLCQAVAERGRRPPEGPPSEGPPSEGRVPRGPDQTTTREQLADREGDLRSASLRTGEGRVPRGPNQPGAGESVPGEARGLAELVLPNELVDTLCEELFFSNRACEQDDNLLFVRERLLRSDVDLATLLHFYERVVAGKRLPDDGTNPLVGVLHLSGIVRAEAGRLLERNRIYEQVFDRSWIAANMPDAEVRRQRAAYRRGLLRATLVAAAIILLLIGLLAYGIHQERRAKQNGRNEARQREQAERNLYAADMILAQQALELNNLGRARELLEKYRPVQPSLAAPGSQLSGNLRGWEWRYLWRLCRSDELYTLGLHTHAVCGVAYSPDGVKLASQSRDGQVKVWDMRTRTETTVTNVQGTEWLIPAFSPDAKFLAVAGSEGVRISDVVTQRAIDLYPPEPGKWLSTFALAPSWSTLAIGHADGQIRLWNVATKTRGLILTEGNRPIHSLAFSPDGANLASGGEDGTVKLWEVATGRLVHDLTNHTSIVKAVAFSPDGGTLVSGGWDEKVKLWDTMTGREKVTLTNHAGWVSSVVFSPDGKALATASGDHTIRLWDGVTYQQFAKLKGHSHEVYHVSFSADGQTLASGGKDDRIKIWSAQARPEEASRLEFPNGDRQGGIKPSPDGKVFVSLTKDGTAILWDAATLREKSRLQTRQLDVAGVAISVNGTELALGTSDGQVKCWDFVSKREGSGIQGHGLVRSVRPWFSPDGRTLLTLSDDHVGGFWDWASKMETGKLSVKGMSVTDVAFSPDGKTIALAVNRQGSLEGMVCLWDVEKRQKLTEFTAHRERNIDRLAFSPDGTRLASASREGTAKLWKLADLQAPVAILKGRLLSVNSVGFSPDGKRLAVVGDHGLVKLWDTETFQEVAMFKGNSGFVFKTFFPNNDALVTASSGIGTVLEDVVLWRAASFEEIRSAEKVSTRAGMNKDVE